MISTRGANLATLQSELKDMQSLKSFDQVKRVVLAVVGLLDSTVSLDDSRNMQLFTDGDGKIRANSTWFFEDSVMADRKATYRVHSENSLNIDFKLFGLNKPGKRTISWVQALTPNFEDEPFNSSFNVGIDFVISKTFDRVIIVLSKNWVVRTLELTGPLTATFQRILSSWSDISSFENKAQVHDLLWNSFDLAPINKLFYEGISQRFISLTQHLVSTNALDELLAAHFANRLIGRLIFSWFLDKKRVLNPAMNYFDASRYADDNDYYRDKLEVLFFDVLNTPKLNRSVEDVVTPFLNGGLFEVRQGDLYQDSKLSFPKNFFDDFLKFLSSYNFTTDESSSQFQQVAIDPEMLGRIFENLLAEMKEETGEMARRAKGSFYTPREVVDYMCRETLREYLKSKIPNDEFLDQRLYQLLDAPDKDFQDQDHNWRRDWKPYKESILMALDSVRVLDPACGSGAFPIGMMQLLLKVYERLEARFDSHKTKLTIIERNIFGVDIDPMAVEISRLRTWLSIVVDEEGGSEKIEPLPNLEFKFVCANSLFELEGGSQTSLFDEDSSLEAQVEVLRDAYFSATSYDKKIELRKEFEKVYKVENSNKTQSRRRIQLQSFNPFDSESITEFFEPAFIFGVDGFDIVIGNPPYVSYGLRGVGKLEKHELDRLKATFIDSAEYKISLYAIFMQRALQLVKSGGVHSFIVPDSFLLGKYYSRIRSYILRVSRIRSIMILSQNVFGAVVGYSIVYVVVKGPSEGNQLTAILAQNKEMTQSTSFSIAQRDFDAAQLKRYRLFFNLEDQEFVQSLESHSRKVSNFVEFKSGLIAKAGQKTITSDKAKTKTWRKGVISGGEIRPFVVNWQGNFINYKKDLIKSGYGNVEYFAPKLFVRQTGDEIICALDDNGFVCLNNVHVGNLHPSELEPEVLIAILNSSTVKRYYQVVSLEKGRAMAQVDIDILEGIPIPDKVSVPIRKKLVAITRKIMNGEQIEPLKREIDSIVENLYLATVRSR